MWRERLSAGKGYCRCHSLFRLLYNFVLLSIYSIFVQTSSLKLLLHVVPVVQKTWAEDLDNVVFYSDIEDANFSTVYSGLPNTEVGASCVCQL